MLPLLIKSCPSVEDFESLSEYQARTPDTFFEGKPVLHHRDDNVKAWVSNEQYEQLYFFSKPIADDSNPLHPGPPESFALENGGKDLREEKKVEVFVSSKKLILFSHISGTGVEIPYPAITLHAIKNFAHLEKPEEDSARFTGVYMQLEFTDSGPDDDESFEPIELMLIPSTAASGEGSSAIDPSNKDRTYALFSQISACSDLNPDPRNEEEDDEDDDFNADHIIFEGEVEARESGEAIEGLPGVLQGDASGGLPPPMPGSSGWITADNVNQYFDEDGNWIGQNGVSGELGDGAGRVRGRDEADKEGMDPDVEGQDGEAKRPRTE
ncbi:regulator of volume decrease after cellular swelling-domain-containing protein [Poronia punctata]|nr:regulator of volume decrease after cellular swelling-domain-containing protein [Poronia punctata]